MRTLGLAGFAEVEDIVETQGKFVGWGVLEHADDVRPYIPGERSIVLLYSSVEQATAVRIESKYMVVGE